MPATTTEVLQRSYGDCNDQPWLLTRLLRGAGMMADVALVNSSDPADPEFPEMAAFDHAIVKSYRMAGDQPEPKFLGPTVTYLDPHIQPHYLQGKSAFAAKPKATTLLYIPCEDHTVTDIRDSSDTVALKPRTSPLETNPHHTILQYRIHLPKGLTANAIPEPIHKRFSPVHYTRDAVLKGDALVIHYEARATALEAPADAAETLINFLRKEEVSKPENGIYQDVSLISESTVKLAHGEYRESLQSLRDRLAEIPGELALLRKRHCRSSTGCVGCRYEPCDSRPLCFCSADATASSAGGVLLCC